MTLIGIAAVVERLLLGTHGIGACLSWHPDRDPSVQLSGDGAWELVAAIEDAIESEPYGGVTIDERPGYTERCAWSQRSIAAVVEGVEVHAFRRDETREML